MGVCFGFLLLRNGYGSVGVVMPMTLVMKGRVMNADVLYKPGGVFVMRISIHPT